MKMMKFATLAIALSIANVASAQGTQQQAPAANAPATAAPAAPAAGMDKKAISKQCSMQADQQKLRGKARKAFRNKCKAAGGKAA